MLAVALTSKHEIVQEGLQAGFVSAKTGTLPLPPLRAFKILDRLHERISTTAYVQKIFMSIGQQYLCD